MGSFVARLKKICQRPCPRAFRWPFPKTFLFEAWRTDLVINLSPVLNYPPLRIAPSEFPSARGRIHGLFFLGAVLCLVSAACSSPAPIGKILFSDPRGSVSLQKISDQSVQASHPVKVEPHLIARVLSGLRVQERQRALQEMLAGSPSATPVFSEEQVRLLAPQIAKALATATAEEVVAFRVTGLLPGAETSERAITDITAGSLYAYGLSLYVTLSQYRYTPGQPNADGSTHRRLPDASGLSNRTLHFTPSAAQRPEGFYQPTGGASTDRVLAIDYQLLQNIVVSDAATEQTAPLTARVAEPARGPLSETRTSGALPLTTEAVSQRDEEMRALKDLVIKKDLELESLRKELQSIRKQLDSQATRQDSQKRKTTPPSKPQPTAP